MKIGMISQWYDPEPGPASLPGVYAREFGGLGHSVKVLTGFPNYPTGNIYHGYRQSFRNTTVNDIGSITRVPLIPSHDTSALGRVANYVSFAASASLLGAGALRGVDALWVYNSPATVTLPLMVHSAFGKIPYFLHVQDLWPESLIESGMLRGETLKKVAQPLIEKVVSLAERKAAVIGVISPSVRDIILERNGHLAEKIIYVPNPTDEQMFRPVSELRNELGVFPDPAFFTIMYAGAVGEAQGLATLLNAAVSVQKTHPQVRFRIVGDGNSRKALEARAQDLGLKNIDFVGRVAQNEVPKMMTTADAQLVSLAPADYLRYTTPSKIASLLASRVPIVGHIAGDGAAMIKDSGAGFVVEPGDIAGLAKAVTDLADLGEPARDLMASSGHEYYTRNLSAVSAATKIASSLTRV